MYEPYMEHSGVKRMHWGIRRYQNMDGSLTPAGRAHYGVGPARKFKTTVGNVLKSIGKGTKTASSRVKTSTAKIAKKIKTSSEEHRRASLAKAIAKGNVKKIAKNLESMSDKELNEALSRARTVKALKDLKAPKKSLSESIGDVATTVTKMAAAAGGIAKARNEHLKYRQAKEEYDRAEDERYEQARQAWEQAHANDPKISDSFKSALQKAKGLKERVDSWPGYNTSEPSTYTPKHPTNTRNAKDLADSFTDALRKAKDLSKSAKQKIDSWEGYDTSGGRKSTPKSTSGKDWMDALDEANAKLEEENKRKLRRYGYM